MDKSKVLSGEELVARSGTRFNLTLPEVGLKDVLPNGSWLEQKQIESALESRKQLIEVPRIEKSGTISHAIWNEDLMLAKVTKQMGSHWQFLGHHIGKCLYLKPEEALFLMEVNCLLLKYNDLKVSMQQAYSLLLRGNINPLKYQVYASLSRVGYRVFQHDYKPLEKGKVDTDTIEVKFDETEKISCDEDKKYSQNEDVKLEKIEVEIEKTINDENVVDRAEIDSNVEKMEVEQDAEEVLGVLNDNNCQIILNTQKQNVSSEVKMDPSSENTILDKKSEHIEETEDVLEHLVQTKSAGEIKNSDIQGNGANDKDLISLSSLEKNKAKHACNNNAENFINVEECHLSNELNDLQNSSTFETQTNDFDTQKIQEISEIESQTDETTHDVNLDKEGVKSVDKSFENIKGNESDNINIVLVDSSNNMDVDKSSVIEIDSEVENTQENAERYKTIGDPKTVEVNKKIKEQKLVNRKLQFLQKRIVRQSFPDSLQKSFENFPDFYQKAVVTVSTPKKELLPKTVVCSNTSYVVVPGTIRNKTKDNRRSSIETVSFSESDEVNGAHVRRVRATIEPSNTADPVSLPTSLNPNASHFWRPRFNFSPNFMFQRSNFAPFPPRFNSYYRFVPFVPRFNSFYRFPFWKPFYNPTFNVNPAFNANSYNTNDNNLPRNIRKRNRKTRKCHLDAIKRLAQRLKTMVVSGATSRQNVEALQSLIQTYNIRYKTNIKLTEEFEVMDGDTILETIELDDEEEPKSKTRKLEPKTQKYEENLSGLKKLALRLREMADKNALTSRHRRAFSSVIKEFNKTYNADVYINEHYQVVDKRYVTLDSSSESDCVVEETPPPPPPSGKLVRNPFNILKKLSQRQDFATSKSLSSNENVEDNNDYKIQYERLKKIFGEKWLPKEDDFGRAEVMPRNLMNSMFVDSKKEEYFYDFFKTQQYQFDSWLDMKVAFFSSFEEPIQFDSLIIEEDQCDIKPIISQEDCLDMPGILSKLSIIKNKKDVTTESSLSVDFDVYNRDVQNFRKSNRPTPHFRVVCLSHESPFPSSVDVAALHSKYSDDVTILLAIVCDSAVSYIQMNPVETPVYMPSNDMDFT